MNSNDIKNNISSIRASRLKIMEMKILSIEYFSLSVLKIIDKVN